MYNGPLDGTTRNRLWNGSCIYQYDLYARLWIYKIVYTSACGRNLVAVGRRITL